MLTSCSKIMLWGGGKRFLTGLTSLVLACSEPPHTSSISSGEELHDVVVYHTPETEPKDVTQESTDNSSVLITPVFPLPISIPYTPASEDVDARAPSRDLPEPKETSEPEKWVKVGNEHSGHWCPPETPIFVAGTCAALEEVICTDTDATEALYKKSDFGDFFEETISLSDKSFGTGGRVTLGLLSNTTTKENFLDVCKNEFILTEQYCSEGLPKSKSIKCDEYLPTSTCVTSDTGEASCLPFDACPTVQGIQSDFLYDTNDDNIKDGCLPDLCPEVAGFQEQFLYDNDGDGWTESCILDVCPAMEDIQAVYPYDTDSDGIPDSCIEDLCKNIEGIQELFLYDNDLDGTPESCAKDTCPEIEGVQTTFLYDTDNDSVKDSCIPDFCPAIEGLQGEFPHDNDQNGIPESCVLDLCPETIVKGAQTEYLYDLDGDGTNDSCVPVDKDFCNEPNPLEKYPEATFYSYDENWHMGFCVGGDLDNILHVICGEDGTWYTDITECQLGMPCVNGACSECYDSDGGNDFDTKGFVISLQKDGGVSSKKDYCLHGQNVDYKVDFICDGKKDLLDLQSCPPGEKCIEEIIDGSPTLSCVAGKEPVCTDSDGAKNFPTIGTTAGSTKEGNLYNYKDKCVSNLAEDAIMDYFCDAENIAQTAYWWCKLNEVCAQEKETVDGVGKSTLKCVPAPYPLTCEDQDGKFNFAEKSYVSGQDKQGEPYVKNDYCVKGASSYIVDYKCEGTIPSASYHSCALDELCKEIDFPSGKTQMLCVPACIDTDPQNDPSIAGAIFDFNNVPYPDVCEGNTLYQYACDTATGEKMEAGMTNCSNGCDNGKCK